MKKQPNTVAIVVIAAVAAAILVVVVQSVFTGQAIRPGDDDWYCVWVDAGVQQYGGSSAIAGTSVCQEHSNGGGGPSPYDGGHITVTGGQGRYDDVCDASNVGFLYEYSCSSGQTTGGSGVQTWWFCDGGCKGQSGGGAVSGAPVLPTGDAEMGSGSRCNKKKRVCGYTRLNLPKPR